jgi:hypothetical protein
VVSEVVLAPERLPADVTRVRSLVRVRPLVDQQVIRLGELPAAKLAYELLLGACGSGPGTGPPTAPRTTCPRGNFSEGERRPGPRQVRGVASRCGVAVEPK